MSTKEERDLCQRIIVNQQAAVRALRRGDTEACHLLAAEEERLLRELRACWEKARA